MTKREAKAFWESQVAEWTAWAEALQEKILAIEDPLLRFAVAALADTVASGYGTVAIRQLTPQKIAADGFYLEEDVVAAIQNSLRERGASDPQMLLFAADQWLRGHFNVSILTIAWSFRHFQNRHVLQQEQCRLLEHRGILFSVAESRFVGVRYDGGIWKVPR